ncbi:MAG: hypothetical protein WAU00_16635 [Caldilinea sp.]|uniref:hypothetical protein n=1 Tax=Caldilinea sp. TaxID=2293560 RepID=UPI002D071776|nr:hypothetical protein [Anaerolineales bacterium]HQY90014.1 hypothetical protein [Caldilinea sp.]HRA68784.1 hypothetical protein [Caldilinea sp.]
MRLTGEQRAILRALQRGDQLKVHRTKDGVKQYLLHPLDAREIEVAGMVVARLARAGLIESNMKFPAATFLLTDKGMALAARITGSAQAPIGPRHFG